MQENVSHEPLIIRFTGQNTIRDSYSEENFGGNQLLDGSISLSPLYVCLIINLHVKTTSGFHQAFAWLHPARVKFAIFRVR